jgi:hypothetical protein
MGTTGEYLAPKRTGMYVSLLRLCVEASQESPLLYVGLIVLLMASWGLIVTAITEIVIRIFDVPGGE